MSVVGIYLNLKTDKSSTSGIFDHSSDDYNEYNTFIPLYATTKKIYFVRTNRDLIKTYLNQADIKYREYEMLLFDLLVRNKPFVIERDLRLSLHSVIPQERNIYLINNYIWYSINSESKKNNRDYYLSESDIIKIGKVKLIVKKIHFQGKTEDEEEKKRKKDNKIFNLIPECPEIKQCSFFSFLTLSFNSSHNIST